MWVPIPVSYTHLGDGYEATNGVDHINEEYMQKVVDYTDVVKNSDYGYMEDVAEICQTIRTTRSQFLLSRLPTIARIIPPSDVPTGLMC